MAVNELEEGTRLALDFTKVRRIEDDVIPAVAQDADTGLVLVVGYANKEALDHTISSGLATFYSTSRRELWVKGRTSGDELPVVEIRVNCEQNCLLYLVRPGGRGACHTKDETGRTRKTCFYRSLKDGMLTFASLDMRTK